MEDDPDFIRGCRDLAERRGGSLSPFIDAPAILFTSWDRVQRSQPDCFPWLSALESPLEVTRGSAQRCKSSCAVSNSSLWYLVLRHLAFRRRHSGFTFVRRCFSSSASSRFSMNCRRNMASTRSCRLADCFLRFPWLFLAQHFTATADIATLVPRWIPAHTFWVYLVGLAFLCAALSIAVLVQARLAAALVGMTLLIFVFVMDMPAVVAHPSNRFFWALMLRELAFSGGAFAFAMSPWSTRPRQPSPAQPIAARAALPRFFVGIPSLFYGVEHLLHPAYAPGVPLQKLTPEWIPGRIFLSYFVGVILIAAGVCLLVNKKTRIAATSLGLVILLTVLWIYLPMLLRAPTDVVALNYFFDTLLFCGAILLLANATDKETPVARITAN